MQKAKSTFNASELGYQPYSLAATLFCCASCQETLKASANGLQCRSCSEYWPVKDGIPHFGGKDHRPSVLTDAQRRKVVDAAVDEGWEIAIHDVLRSIDRVAYRQAIDEYRAQWRFILPLSSSDYVLDLNCAWGAVTFNLSEICALVVAADPCSEYVRFVAQRARQKGQNNIVPLQLGLDQSLPFLPRRFDTVVMVDSLSWFPDIETQRLILNRIHNVIKTGGCLFLADTNRLSCVSLLARASAGTPHTLHGYQRLLRSVGFRRLREYVLAPSHMEPFFILPLDTSRPLEFFLREIIARQDFGMHFRSGPQKLAFRMARAVTQRGPTRLLARLARPFIPSFAIVAQA